MISAKILKTLSPELITYVSGNIELSAGQILPPEISNQESLVFVSSQEQLTKAIQNHSPIIIALDSVKIPIEVNDNACFFSTAKIPQSMAKVFPLFDRKLTRFSQPESIHTTATVHPSAKIGHHCIIGPYVFIGENTAIEDNCIIGAHSVIESNCMIGSHTLLHPQVFIGSACKIGKYCEIHPHTTIGSDGFGYAKNKEGKNLKIPQLGNVIIEDHVEIGANCAIDRAALTSTIIRSGTKLDNLCHIAHNCQIGEDSLIAAGFFIAGSSKIGKNFSVGGNSVVSDHVNISDNITIGGRSTVTNDITEPGIYAGYPIQPIKDALKTLVNFTHLTEMRKQINQIMKHLNLN